MVSSWCWNLVGEGAGHRKEQGDKGWGKRSFRQGCQEYLSPNFGKKQDLGPLHGKEVGTPEHNMANQAPRQPALPPRVQNFEDLKFRGSS